MNDGFRKGPRIIPGYISADFKRRLDALRGHVSPNNRIATPKFWDVETTAVAIAFAVFMLVCVWAGCQ